jgi:hypothetical protein
MSRPFLFRARHGQYRAVYIVAAANLASVVFIIGPLENIYRAAERRARAARRQIDMAP